MRSLAPARRRDGEQGVISVELAFALPIVVGLLFGSVEITQYLLVHQKLERTSASVADLVAQSRSLNEPGLASLLAASEQVMRPFDLDGGRVVVSSLVVDGQTATIVWQRSHGGGTEASQLGVETEVAALPGAFTDATGALKLPDGDNLIVCEAFYDYAPIVFEGVVEAQTLYRWAAFRPRFGPLETIAP